MAENRIINEVTISLTVFKNKLLVEIENSAPVVPSFKDGLPCSEAEGHGYGTKSIRTIAESHGGEAIFRYSDTEKKFNLKIMIPLT